MFEKNVGNTDRYVRFVLGIVLLAIAIYVGFTGSATVAIIIGIVSLIPLVTASLNTCPLYSLFGMSTNSTDKA